MRENIFRKYNVPVPRYTSYPPANYFRDFTEEEYIRAIGLSNQPESGIQHLSFYFHMPFCRHLCHYCACNSYPMRNEQEVIDYLHAVHQEIDLLTPLLDRQRLISQIHYGGGSPSAIHPPLIRRINERLLSAFGTIEQPEIAIECHPGYLSKDDWKQLLEAGFTRFSIGVQDFDEQVLYNVNRRPSKEPLDEVIELLKDGGAGVNLDLLYGLPGQTAESFAKTVEQAIRLQPDRLVTFGYAHVPWMKPRQRILENKGLPGSESRQDMTDRADRLLTEAGYRKIGLDHYVKPDDELSTALESGQLHRNFQGYCTRRTTAQVYALGVTGISQLDTAYAQNTKDIDEYITTVGKGHLPVKKGYALTREDQLVREVIDTLMCNYSVTLTEEQHEAVNLNEERLAEMVDDGIITWEDNTIRMTRKDSPFVRNVAALLDPLMSQSTKAFSKPI